MQFSGLGRSPRDMGYYGIRSTSRRYASYWNAFLLIFLLLGRGYIPRSLCTVTDSNYYTETLTVNTLPSYRILRILSSTDHGLRSLRVGSSAPGRVGLLPGWRGSSLSGRSGTSPGRYGSAYGRLRLVSR